MSARHLLVWAPLLLAAGCAPATPPAPAAPVLTPVVTVKELMTHIIDPIADWVFDAVGVDVTAAGVTEIKPVSDEEWLKVESGAITLAESANLLKMRRLVAPADDHRVNQPGQPAPELSTAEIQAKIDGDFARWEQYVDQLRTASLDALTIIRKRDVQGLYTAGSLIDDACESCHLEYWYPGDKALIEADAKKRATYGNN